MQSLSLAFIGNDLGMFESIRFSYESGHDITGIVSDNADIIDWSKENDISIVSINELDFPKCDYVFCTDQIINIDIKRFQDKIIYFVYPTLVKLKPSSIIDEKIPYSWSSLKKENVEILYEGEIRFSKGYSWNDILGAIHSNLTESFIEVLIKLSRRSSDRQKHLKINKAKLELKNNDNNASILGLIYAFSAKYFDHPITIGIPTSKSLNQLAALQFQYPQEKMCISLDVDLNMSLPQFITEVLQISPDLKNLSKENSYCFTLFEDINTISIDQKINVPRYEFSQTKLWFVINDQHVQVYSTDQNFDCEMFAKAFLNFQNNIVSHNNLNQCDLLSGEERKKLLYDLNETKVDFPDNTTIDALIQKQAEITPSVTALEYGDKSVSYEALNKITDSVAWQIQQIMPHSNEFVGVCLYRSLELFYGILGIIKSGSAYLPLDPNMPHDRVQYILQDSQAKTVITTRALQPILSKFLCKLIFIEDILDKENNQKPAIRSTPDSFAYVIYTSGSTGKPKGTPIRHRGLCNFAVTHGKNFQINQTSRMLQFASVNFDACVLEWATTLTHGGTLCIVDKEDLVGEHFVTMMNDKKITVAHPAPSLLSTLKDPKIPTLETIIIGGEACSLDVLNYWEEHTRNTFNSYGPTEGTICATLHRFKKGDSSTTIGRPLNNIKIYILDKFKQPVPFGKPGELHIAGVGVTGIYLNKSELMKEKFFNNKWFETAFDKILYATGDLAKYNEDNTIEYLGRVDKQIKIRSYRVELSEIEHHINSFSNIKGCFVKAFGELSNKYLVAYFLSPDSQISMEKKLRNYLSKKLPEYMVPAFFVKLEAFPVNTSGKIDQDKLPAVTDIKYKEEENSISDFQIELQNIYKKILRHDHVPVHKSFFELGGNSLTATQVVSLIHKELKIQIDIPTFFNHSSVQSLSQYINQNDSLIKKVSSEVPKHSRDQLLPLSYAQQRLWFLYKLEDQKGHTYNIPQTFEIKGALNIEYLEEAFRVLINRHEILRTSFIEKKGVAFQKINNSIDFNITVEDTTSENVVNLLKSEYCHVFDLTSSSLLRVRLFKVSKNHYFLCLNQHNIITDGWSVGLLLTELSEIFNTIARNETLQLQPAPQYVDFGIEQRKKLESQEFSSQLSYWKNKLMNAKELDFPTDYERPQVQTYNGGNFIYSLSKELSEKIQDFSKDNQLTIYMTLLGTFKILMYRYSHQQDIMLGSGIANRNNFFLEKIMGFFVNTLALRTDFSGSPTFIEALYRVRRTTL